MTAAPLADRLRRQVAEMGPIPVSVFVGAALYDPIEGFYASGGRVGRGGDFLTAAEVGPLFGAVIARALDTWWNDLDCPASFSVIDYGAGPGTLARSVIAAEPSCLEAGALVWTMVEWSDAQRARHLDHPALVSVAELPEDGAPASVVMAHELLDNLPFDVVEFTATGWNEVVIDITAEEGFGACLGRPVGTAFVDLTVPVGTRLPVQTAARGWVAEMHKRHPGSRLLVLDYGAPTSELAARGNGWLRTFREHDDSRPWLDDPGSCDITVDVDLTQIQLDHPATRVGTQAEFLRRHGIEQLVEEGRAAWENGAHVGDLAALRGRSRIREAETLLDVDGMGSFVAVEWVVERVPSGSRAVAST